MQAYFPLTTFIFSFHGLLSESARLKSFLIPKAFSIAFIRDHQTVKIRFRTVLHKPSCMNRSDGFGDPWSLHNSTFVTISGFCFNSSSKYSNFLPNWSWRFPRLYFSSSGWSRETRIFFWGIISSSKTSSSFGKNSVSKILVPVIHEQKLLGPGPENLRNLGPNRTRTKRFHKMTNRTRPRKDLLEDEKP